MTCCNRIFCGCQLWEYGSSLMIWIKSNFVLVLWILWKVVLFFNSRYNSCSEIFENIIWLQLIHGIRQLHPVAPLKLLGSNENQTIFATYSKPPQNEVRKVRYLITFLKLSGLDGIRTHIKAIQIRMGKFQRRSQRSSKYTVHKWVRHCYRQTMLTWWSEGKKFQDSVVAWPKGFLCSTS